MRFPVAGVLAATAGTVAFFWPLFFGFTFSTVATHQQWVYPWHAYQSAHGSFPQSDQADLNYPWQAFQARSLRAGDLPLWNPLSFGGQPFLSNGSSGVLYPPRLLAALLFSPSAAHDFISVFHVFGACLAMFLLCRQLRLGVAGSLLGATSWMFASFNMAWLHLEVVSPVTVLLPLSLLLVRRVAVNTSTGGVVAAAFVLGLTLVSGHLLIMGTVWAVAVGYGLWCAAGAAHEAPPGSRRRTTVAGAMRLAAAALGGLALFACVLLPTAFTVNSSHRRTRTYDEVHAFVRSQPHILLNVFRPPPPPPQVSDEPMNREMAFVGTAAGVLALLGCFRRGPAPALGRTLAAVVLLLALDTPLLRLAYALVPALTLVAPLGRLFFLLNLALALLAAAGIDGVLGAARDRRRRWSASRPEQWERTAATVEAAVVCALIAANAVQLIRYGRSLNPPFHPRTSELLFPRTPLIQEARKHVRRFDGRLLNLNETRLDGAWRPPVLYAAEPLIFELPTLGGYDSVPPARALHLCLVTSGVAVDDVLGDLSMGAYRSDFPVGTVRFELLPRLGVTAIVAPPGISRSPYWPRTRPLLLEPQYAAKDGELYRIAGAPGAAWLAARALLVDSESDALRRMADPAFDFRREVILQRADAPWAGTGSARAADVPEGEVRIESKRNNRLVIGVRSDRGGWLVVADTWDRGWQASLDGRPAALLAANYAFRGVRVPPGEHRVEMRYVPAGFIAGLLVSGMALLSGVAALAARRLPGKRGGRTSAAV